MTATQSQPLVGASSPPEAGAAPGVASGGSPGVSTGDSSGGSTGDSSGGSAGDSSGRWAPSSPSDAALRYPLLRRLTGGGTRAAAGALRQRVELAALLVGVGVLYVWDLAASGWANAFYSAAAQAGSQNWEAFFFGSSDAANAITVDKPPAALWIMDLSVRIFGLSSWSILVPEALMGVGAAWILYLAVRRALRAATGSERAAHGAGLVAAAALALTPIAALMFRFNNPDALLVLLMTAAGYATIRSVQSGRARWILFAGVLLGFGFLTKQLQVLLVVPGFAAAYLWAAPHRLGRRLLHLLGALGAMAVSAGWWIVAVMLTPAADRPFIGGSQTNSILELTFGYNGFGRLSGDEVGSVGGGNGWGQPGLFRLFSSTFGGQIAWLLPASLILGAALLWVGRQAPRTDAVRSSVVVWGGWVLVTGLTFSLMHGIIHEYYSVALVPGIAALVGLGGGILWHRRRYPVEASALAVAVAAAGIMGVVLLNRASGFVPWLAWVVALAALVAAAAIASGGFGVRLPRLAGPTTAALALVAALAGPFAFTLDTVSTAHSGAIVTAGPSSGFGGRGGFGGPGGQRNGQGFLGFSQNGTGTAQSFGQAGGFGGGRGGAGGLLGAPTPSSALVTALQTDASKYTWAAAVVGSNNAAGYQLATQLPVMAIGGFNGTDPAPTLAQFQQLVKEGKIHYFIAASLMQGSTGSNDAQQIEQWVAANFQAQTIGNATVYALGS